MNPRDLGLNYDEFRPVQEYALRRIQQSQAKVIILQAPTGSGKSLIGVASGRLLGLPTVYCATTKQLQDQLIRDFPEAKALKGRSNYIPERYQPPEPGCQNPSWHKPNALRVTCEDCAKPRCPHCHSVRTCPYEGAKITALMASLAVLNTSYWLSEVNFVGRWDGVQGGKSYANRLIVLDEADTLESQLMSFVEVSISERRLQSLRLTPPIHKNPKDKAGQWGEWLHNRALPAVKRALEDAMRRVEALKSSGDTESLVRAVRDERYYSTLYRRLQDMSEDLTENADSWVRTDDGTGRLTFKPVTVERYGQGLIWQHGYRFLVMSATIIVPSAFAHDLGLEDGEWEFVDLPSTFPVSHRPVYVMPSGNLTRKLERQNMSDVVEALDGILDSHPDDRVLVHTVSYSRARDVLKLSRHASRMMTFDSAADRVAVLERYKSTPGAVLLAPAMERGVDLPDDLARVVVVLKVPYPNLGDKQVAARFYGHGRSGRVWYTIQTIRTLCQATGRGVRHEEDHCDTYILDGEFMRLWKEYRHIFPRWWRDAVQLKPKPNNTNNTNREESAWRVKTGSF